MAFLRFVFAAVLVFVQLWHSETTAVKEFQDWEGLKQDLTNTDYAMVDFYASWCPHCITMAPQYEKAAEIIEKGNLKDKVHLIKIKCNTNKGESNPICTANDIQGFPTIFVYKQGKKLEQYKGGRTPEAIVNYVEQLVKTGKSQFAGKNANDQQVCLAKDFSKYVIHKS